MTPRSLFAAILKIFGLFFLKDLIETIPQVAAEGITGVIFSLLIIAFYVFVCYQLFFKTNKIIDALHLDKGFDEERFSFKISLTTILRIAVIVIGGVILVSEIPNFCRYLVFYLRQTRNPFPTQPDISYLIVAGVKVIIGLLLIGESRRIVAYIENRGKHPVEAPGE